MRINEYISEISTPTGSIFIRFKEKLGDVSANPQRGAKSEAKYLTAYAGFANAPEDLKQADALRNFNKIQSADDIVNMIKSIFTDKVFLSAKSVTIYDDFTDPMRGPSSAIYKRYPFLLKFMNWVDREGGDRIKIADKVKQEGPPKLKRPRKENPNKGRDIRDVDVADPKYTVTFTVDDRFYREVERRLPNIAKYRGPNRTFVMPNELFMKFREMAKEQFPRAEIKVVKRAHTSESTGSTEPKKKVIHCSQCSKGFSADGVKAPHHTGFSHCKDHKGLKVVASEGMAPTSGPEWDRSGGHHGLGEEADRSDGSPYSRGVADGYYGRPFNPHKLVDNGKGNGGRASMKLTDPSEIAEYKAGYNDDSFGSKDYGESVEESQWGPPEEILRNVQQTLEREIEWPLTEIMDAAMVKKLLAPLHHAIAAKINELPEDGELDEKASRAFCTDPSIPRSKMGASNLSSCISQGFLSHNSGKSVKVAGKRIKLRGTKLRGEKYGGPKSSKAG